MKEFQARILFVWRQLFIVLDQALNWVLGVYPALVHGSRDYWADETISAHAWRKSQGEDRRWIAVRKTIDILFLPQDYLLKLETGRWPPQRHCERSFVSERKKMQMPPEYRNKEDQ